MFLCQLERYARPPRNSAATYTDSHIRRSWTRPRARGRRLHWDTTSSNVFPVQKQIVVPESHHSLINPHVSFRWPRMDSGPTDISLLSMIRDTGDESIQWNLCTYPEGCYPHVNVSGNVALVPCQLRQYNLFKSSEVRLRMPLGVSTIGYHYLGIQPCMRFTGGSISDWEFNSSMRYLVLRAPVAHM